MPWYSKMYFNEKDCLPKTGNGKAIILSTRAAFYLSASVFQPESNATNQQIVISSYEVLFSVYFWIKEILLHHVEIFRQTGLIKNCHKFNNQLYQLKTPSLFKIIHPWLEKFNHSKLWTMYKENRCNDTDGAV